MLRLLLIAVRRHVWARLGPLCREASLGLSGRAQRRRRALRRWIQTLCLQSHTFRRIRLTGEGELCLGWRCLLLKQAGTLLASWRRGKGRSIRYGGGNDTLVGFCCRIT